MGVGGPQGARMDFELMLLEMCPYRGSSIAPCSAKRMATLRSGWQTNGSIVKSIPALAKLPRIPLRCSLDLACDLSFRSPAESQRVRCVKQSL